MLKIKLKRPDARESVLYVELMKNRQRLKFYTGKTIQCRNWSEKKQEVLTGEENYSLINDYLVAWRNELSRIIAEMEAKGCCVQKME